jgi:ABC-type sugar transport system substrate-binding protein
VARIAAETLAKLIGYEGKVGLIPFVPGAATSIQREQGFKEGLKKFPKVQVGGDAVFAERCDEGDASDGKHADSPSRFERHFRR